VLGHLQDHLRVSEAGSMPIDTGSSPGIKVSDLAPLWFSRYRLRVAPRTALALPTYGRGAFFRGGFGKVLRRLVCHDMSLACRTCPLIHDCPYPNTFENRSPKQSNGLPIYGNLPPPFAIDVPRDGRAEFKPGEVLEFGFTVMGQANRFMPQYVNTFRTLAREGLGPQRTSFDLLGVAAIGREGLAPTYARAGDRFVPSVDSWRAADLVRPGDDATTAIELRFFTPTQLKDAGARLDTPAFGAIIRRLRDRASALAASFCDGPLSLDWDGISALADQVRLVDDRTQIVVVSSRSSRAPHHDYAGGFVGQARYEGAGLGKLMPLLRIAEVIHVGKHASFGNGEVAAVA
jgi:hypothetical protein